MVGGEKLEAVRRAAFPNFCSLLFQPLIVSILPCGRDTDVAYGFRLFLFDFGYLGGVLVVGVGVSIFIRFGTEAWAIL